MSSVHVVWLLNSWVHLTPSVYGRACKHYESIRMSTQVATTSRNIPVWMSLLMRALTDKRCELRRQTR